MNTIEFQDDLVRRLREDPNYNLRLEAANEILYIRLKLSQAEEQLKQAEVSLAELRKPRKRAKRTKRKK